IDEVDMANLSAVRELYDEIDPLPDGLTERVRFALSLEHLDAEVARLVEKDALAGVRSGSETAEETRSIIFECSALSVMISVSPAAGDLVRVDGWLSPEGEYRVELRTPQRQFRTAADATGRFVIEEVPRGIFRMVIRPSERNVREGMPPVVITPSVVLD
ncbi:MAG: hypothetical protein ACRDXX_14910, partial [Stackebrandtia sp.]